MGVAVFLGVLYGALLGACFASFCCVLAERVPAGESINGRSHCVCGRQLTAGQNIPVFGWLSCRGTARCCGAKLPARYLYAELAYAAWGAAVTGVLQAYTHTHGFSVPAVAVAVAAMVAFGAGLTRVCWHRPAS